MTTVVKREFGEGGANITDSHGGEAHLADALRDAVDDVAELRTKMIALLTKMDVDFTAQNIAVGSSQLDEDYATALTPAAQTLTKG